MYMDKIVSWCYEGGGSLRPLKEQVSITLDAEVIASIRKLAEEDDRSFSQYVNMVLKEHLKTKEA